MKKRMQIAIYVHGSRVAPRYDKFHQRALCTVIEFPGVRRLLVPAS
jgi:hypothetical protein